MLSALASPEEFRRLPPDEMASVVRSGRRAPATWRERTWAFVMLGRPRTCVPGLLCYVLGHSYTGAPFSARVVLGGLLSFLIGFAANAHNAYTDIEEDSRNLPGRVYLVAQIGHATLRRTLAVLPFLMVAGAALLEPLFLAFMVLAVIGLHQYSFPPSRAKDRPVLGLWVFSQAVVFPFLFGWTTEPPRMLSAVLAWLAARINGEAFAATDALGQGQRCFGMFVFLTLWFMAKGTFKNVPDFFGDRAAGLRTSATVCGSWRKAALVAAVSTVAAYLSLAALVVLGLESARLLLALVWLVPVVRNCLRLLEAEDGAKGNACLKADMLLSSGFIASVLLLVAPRPESVGVVAIASAILFGSDRLGVDSRRAEHALQPAAR